jgi:hypothetical protein
VVAEAAIAKGQHGLRGIQQRLQLVDSVAELIRTAEFADDCVHVAVVGNGREGASKG